MMCGVCRSWLEEEKRNVQGYIDVKKGRSRKHGKKRRRDMCVVVSGAEGGDVSRPSGAVVNRRHLARIRLRLVHSSSSPRLRISSSESAPIQRHRSVMPSMGWNV